MSSGQNFDEGTPEFSGILGFGQVYRIEYMGITTEARPRM